MQKEFIEALEFIDEMNTQLGRAISRLLGAMRCEYFHSTKKMIPMIFRK